MRAPLAQQAAPLYGAVGEETSAIEAGVEPGCVQAWWSMGMLTIVAAWMCVTWDAAYADVSVVDVLLVAVVLVEVVLTGGCGVADRAACVASAVLATASWATRMTLVRELLLAVLAGRYAAAVFITSLPAPPDASTPVTASVRGIAIGGVTWHERCHLIARHGLVRLAYPVVVTVCVALWTYATWRGAPAAGAVSNACVDTFFLLVMSCELFGHAFAHANRCAWSLLFSGSSLDAMFFISIAAAWLCSLFVASQALAARRVFLVLFAMRFVLLVPTTLLTAPQTIDLDMQATTPAASTRADMETPFFRSDSSMYGGVAKLPRWGPPASLGPALGRRASFDSMSSSQPLLLGAEYPAPAQPLVPLDAPNGSFSNPAAAKRAAMYPT